MNIIYCIDENYVKITKKSIKSVLKFNPKANIIIVSEKPIEDFKEFQTFTIDLSSYEFRKRKENDRLSKATYLRLFLPQLLPFDRCIYLDSDIICQRPLKELYDMDCDFINVCESHSFGKTQANEMGISRYANTGVMLMNLANLRAENFTEKCIEKQYYNVSLWCHDETMINGTFNNRLKFIDNKFNYCHNRQYENPINENDAYLLHFVGGHKEEMPDIDNEYQNIPEVKEFIKGKRVALVGNAQSIFEKQNGQIIDSYDVVIRFNKGFIKVPESQGKKTSIHMLAVVLKGDECNLLNPKFKLNRSRFYDNPCENIMWADRKRLVQVEIKPKETIEHQPSTGFMAIDLCLSSKASEIALFGFDFGKTQSFPNDPNYVPLHDFKKEEQYVKTLQNAGLISIL